MIFLFMGCKGLAVIGNWVIMPICLFWESTTPSASLEASVLSRKSIVESVEARAGLLMQACFKA